MGLVHGGPGRCGSKDTPGIYARLHDRDVLEFVKRSANFLPTEGIITEASRDQGRWTIKQIYIRRSKKVFQLLGSW